jgi:UDP-N-acetylmuramate dehydrogenase
MKILYNESLAKYTTVKIGGCAQNLFIPESVNELTELIDSFSKSEYYLIGAGSNILMNDEKVYKNVVLLKNFDNSIRNLGDGKYHVGASVRLQMLINEINRDGFGGIEYLYSVPGLVGGAIVMNAGRGKQWNICISDYLTDVTALINGTVQILGKNQCGFEYRTSIFKNKTSIVLGASFNFEKKGISESTNAKKERMAFCALNQDNSKNNFGSVFLSSDWRIMRLMKLLHPGYKNGMAFSKKTPNWLLNKGNGKFQQAIRLIHLVERMHKFLGKKAIPEVIIWK